MKRSILSTALGLLCTALPLGAQGVVVDQGHFSVRIDGQEVGGEDFVIRRAGLGSGDAIFASGVITRQIGSASQELRPLLRVRPLDGSAESYQISVAGPEAMEVRLIKTGRRYVATLRSAAGDEDREFQALPETRVLERGVAHHYYFLRGVRAGRESSVLEPRTRSQLTLVAGESTSLELRLGPNVVEARRVVFSSEDGTERVVWFDRQGRVLRVEIPERRYVAERTDLVG